MHGHPSQGSSVSMSTWSSRVLMPVMYSLAGLHEAFVIVIFGSQDATTDVLSTDIVVNQEVSCITPAVSSPAVSSPDIDREKRVKHVSHLCKNLL